MADRTIRVIPARNRLDLPAEDRQKLRVAAYARVSTASDEQMGSVAAQKDYFEKLIQKKPEWELVEIYSDEGISGTSLNHREAFNRMVTDALAGKIDLIVTKSLSRFARNTVDTLNTIHKLKIAGIAVYFEKEQVFEFPRLSIFFALKRPYKQKNPGIANRYRDNSMWILQQVDTILQRNTMQHLLIQCIISLHFVLGTGLHNL